MRIKQADLDEVLEVARLALVLWPYHSMHAIALEISEMIQRKEGAYFLAYNESEAIGFAQINLIHSSVDEENGVPVGYLKGIFVVEAYRQQGIAKELLTACEHWAIEQGCEELTSDCELSNDQILNFHRSVGFEESNRIVCFRKSLKGEK